MVLSIWNVRSRFSQLQAPLNEIYDGMSNYFTLKVHHKGIFTRSPRRRYVDGEVDYVDYVDIDLFSVHELDAMVTDLGYVKGETLFYHFRIPEIDLDFGLLPLGNDADVIKMAPHVATFKEISIYIEHGFTRIRSHHLSPNKVVIQELDVQRSPELNRNPRRIQEVGSASKSLNFSQCLVPYHKPLLIEGNGEENVADIEEGVAAIEGDIEVDLAANEEHVADIEDVEEEVDGFLNDDGEAQLNEDSDEYDGSTKSQSVFDGEDVLNDVEVNMNDFCSTVDEDLDMGNFDQTEKETEVDKAIPDDPVEVLDNEVFETGGNEQDPRRKMIKALLKPTACSSGEFHKKAFMVGQSFKNKKEVRELIDNYSVVERRDIHYVKNDKTRLRVKCRGIVPQLTGVGNKGKGNLVHSKEKSCPWILLVSRTQQDELWTIKTYEDGHTCLQTRKVKACSSKYLANTILQQIEGNPTIPARALHEELQKKYSLSLSKMQVFRAKALARQYVFGDYEKQFGMLRNYAMELQSKNPGTTVKIEVHSEPNSSVETRIFKRIYVSLGCLKQGFKAGLRDFIGLDGAFLKGPFPGQLLSAVRLDSNNGIYPVAYAIVEAENQNSWTWFLELLGDDLDLQSNSNFTFISDRQKGILHAISKVFPAAEHRFCLRHLHENMKLQWRGDDLKDQLWKCGRATNIPTFERAMEGLRKLNPKAHEWLLKIPAKHWARSHFSGRALTDSLLNNLCEVFNSKIDGGRDKPIITCLEFVREYIMKKMVIVQQEIDKCKGTLTPAATLILEENKVQASQMRCIFNGSEKYQVTGQWMDQYVVNLIERSCTCRNWDITGIPCKHAIAAMNDKLQNGSDCGAPENWVHKCHWLSTWIDMYKNKVEPINGKNMWPISPCPTTLLPPKHHTQVGRPKKKRKRAADEPSQSQKLSRKYLTVTCSKCHNKGHNQRSCKGQGRPSDVVKGSKKRKGKAAAV